LWLIDELLFLTVDFWFYCRSMASNALIAEGWGAWETQVGMDLGFTEDQLELDWEALILMLEG